MNVLDLLMLLVNFQKLRFDSRWNPLEELNSQTSSILSMQQKPPEDYFITKYSNGPCNPSSSSLVSENTEYA